jgi:hypothetical protein
MSLLDNVKVLVNKLGQRLAGDNWNGVATAEEYHSIFMEFLGKPATLEVKSQGEVYTPLWLVTDMLDKLPVSVWSDPSLKWFEPACGLAPFLYMAYHRLMTGLEVMIPDYELRRRHILETMFYFNEIQPKNIGLFKVLFNAQEYKLNLFEGDAMTVVPSSFRADIIVGNPPYNTSTDNKGSSHSLWDKFVMKILTSWLTPNGYSVVVTPSRWRQGADDLFTTIKKLDLLTLSIYNEASGMKTFGCNTRYDIYLVCNRSYNGVTTISDEKGQVVTIDINTLSFIPNYNFVEIGRLLARDNEERVAVIRTTTYHTQKKWMSKVQDATHRYPCVNSVNRANQPTFRWSSVNDLGMFGVPKVIFGSGATGVIVDASGEYGLTEWSKAVIAPVEDLEGIKDALLSPQFSQINKALAVGQASINHKLLAYFKKDFWRELLSLELSPLITTGDKCQSVTTKGTQCTRKMIEGGHCKQHSKGASVSQPPSNRGGSSSSSSADLDRQRLENSVGRKGYTVDQLKSYARERSLAFKSTATKEILRELLLTS